MILTTICVNQNLQNLFEDENFSSEYSNQVRINLCKNDTFKSLIFRVKSYPRFFITIDFIGK